jgi:hypothetical protein
MAMIATHDIPQGGKAQLKEAREAEPRARLGGENALKRLCAESVDLIVESCRRIHYSAMKE